METTSDKKKPRSGPPPRKVQVSKKLSWLLRHGAAKEGLQLDSGGFLPVSTVLANRNLKSLRVTFEEIEEVVREDGKGRFTMVDDEGEWKIRANQGHSLKVESEGLLKAMEWDEVVMAVHGTTHAAWVRIVESGGLKTMGRNHVHFASGLPEGFTDEEKGNAPPVISGMRNSSTILVFVDVKKAMMEKGLKFWRSDNGVILTEGDGDGLVPLEVFEKVEDRTGEGVLVENGKIIKEAPTSWKGKGK
jgi:2'-phosphotransferase